MVQAPEQISWTTREAQEEVKRFMSAISAVGINLDDLVESTPRSWRERERAKNMALTLANNPEMVAHLRDNPDSVPWKWLEDLKLDPGFFQRFSKYIKAIIIIMSQPYPVLGSMTRPWVGGDV